MTERCTCPRRSAVALLAVALIASERPTAAALEQGDKTAGSSVERVVSLTDRASQDLVRRVLAHPGVAEGARGHRLVALRVTARSTADATGEAKVLATLVLFDHTALEARRVVFDAVSGRVLANERLPGRPQSSRAEVDEAVRIVRRDPDLARLLDGGGVLDGGFIVDDPVGSRRRMIQLKLMSGDRRTLLRTITVDLTRQEVASVSDPHGMAITLRITGRAARSSGGR